MWQAWARHRGPFGICMGRRRHEQQILIRAKVGCRPVWTLDSVSLMLTHFILPPTWEWSPLQTLPVFHSREGASRYVRRTHTHLRRGVQARHGPLHPSARDRPTAGPRAAAPRMFTPRRHGFSQTRWSPLLRVRRGPRVWLLLAVMASPHGFCLPSALPHLPPSSPALSAHRWRRTVDTRTCLVE